MKSSYYIAGSLLSGALLLFTGCGDNHVSCGAGTTEVNGVCVGGGECGAGTVEVDGACVPDGTMICSDGTVYDEASGSCVLDPSACGEDQVVVDGRCVDQASVTPDFPEPPEGNGFGENDEPGVIELPAVGGMATIGGCITPMGDLPDYDLYVFNASGPTLLDITADGYGGLAAGFLVLTGVEDLANNGWIRYGVNLVNDMSQRQVFLPAAGVYGIAVADSRSLFFDNEPAVGDDGTCYMVTVNNLTIPDPTPVVTSVQDNVSNDVFFYSYDGELTDGDVLFGTTQAPGASILIDTVVVTDGTYRTSAPGPGNRAFGEEASVSVANLSPGQEVLLVVEPVLNYGLSPVPFDLTVDSPNVVGLPGDGTPITVESTPGYFSWVYFDVSDNEVLYLDYSNNTGDGTLMYVVDENLLYVAGPCPDDIWGPILCNNYQGHIHFVDGGRYYLAVYDYTDPQPLSFEITATLDHIIPGDLAVGTPQVGDSVRMGGSNFYALTPNAFEWWQFNGDPSAFQGSMDIGFYNPMEQGELGFDMASMDSFSLNGFTEVGRIIDSGAPLLVQVEDSGFGGTPTQYDFSVDDRVYTDLGAVDENTSVSLTDLPLPPDGLDRYVVWAGEGWTANITLSEGANTPIPFDGVIDKFDRFENIADFADNGGTSAPEMLPAIVGSGGWVAFSVYEYFGDEAEYNLDVDALPPPYEVAPDNVAWQDACAVGEVHPTVEDDSGIGDPADEGISQIPIAVGMPNFDFFGETPTEITVSTNGWLSFDGPTTAIYSNVSMPDPSTPNNLIAPFWDDLIMTGGVCTIVNMNQVVVQWQGIRFGTGENVEFQAILNDDRTIQFVYGPSHELDSGSATLGIENSDGTRAVFPGPANTPGLVASGWRFTPTN